MKICQIIQKFHFVSVSYELRMNGRKYTGRATIFVILNRGNCNLLYRRRSRSAKIIVLYVVTTYLQFLHVNDLPSRRAC